MKIDSWSFQRNHKREANFNLNISIWYFNYQTNHLQPSAALEFFEFLFCECWRGLGQLKWIHCAYLFIVWKRKIFWTAVCGGFRRVSVWVFWVLNNTNSYAVKKGNREWRLTQYGSSIKKLHTFHHHSSFLGVIFYRRK